MSLKSIVGRLKLQRLRNRMEPAELDFPASLLRTKQILICLPEGLKELTIIKQFLPMIKDMFESADITLMPLPGVRVNDIYPRKGFYILTSSFDQATWFGLPRKSYIKNLQDRKFDMVLDLNFQQSIFTSAVLLGFPKAVRIGRGNTLGKPFYNLEIKTRYLRDERNIYRSLLQTLKTIRNTCATGTVPGRTRPIT